jgi:hypothetical protein
VKLRRALAAAALSLGAARAGAQEAGGQGGRPVVRVLDAGSAPEGRLLRQVLDAPHVVRRADGGRARLPRDTTFATTVIVVGGTATVASRVRGDVIVVGGDLFLHPGAAIEGRAVAIGGCVYNSTLATVRGERVCFREGTFAATEGADGSLELRYEPAARERVPSGALPGFYGFRVPGYDRVNGLSLGWGPALRLDGGRYELEPRATYRSHLGDVDPSAVARVRLGRGYTVEAEAARGTFSNDRWIRSDFVNAVGAFGLGTDTRNYYRADRGEARLVRTVEAAPGPVAVYAGVRAERARRVGPDSAAVSAPFAVFNRRDREQGMLRPNPQTPTGRIASAVVGAAGEFTTGDLVATSGVALEAPFDAPGDGRWVQLTADAQTAFLGFAGHRVEAGVHLVLTRGDSTPAQRYAYLGGSGTLQTEELLSFGGDMLLFVDGAYLVPLTRIVVPFVGSPSIGVRYAAGSAGVGDLPRFAQNVGLRLALGPARLDLIVNPATGESTFGVGVTALR